MKHIYLISFSMIFSCYAYSQSINPLLDSLESLLEKEKIPGAMISIVKKDTVLFSGGIGFADWEQKEKVTDQHLFRIGSVSKMFTALAIMRLVEQGKLKLTDKVLDIVPDIPIDNSWKETSPVLVAHLLEHTAGFDDMHFHAIYNISDNSAPTLEEVMPKHKTALKSRWKPGTRMSYSNVGYFAAGLVIEKISGMSFRDFLKKELLNPLGMQDSGFYFDSPKASFPMSKGYTFQNGTYQAVPYTPIYAEPAGSLCTNAKDMTSFLQFMLNKKLPQGQSFLQKNSIERTEGGLTSLAAKKGLNHQYGLGNYSIWDHGFHFQGHNGGIDGFITECHYSTEADFAFVISVNSFKSLWAFQKMILDYFLGDTHTITNRKTLSIPKEIVEKYEGFYSNQSPRVQVIAFIDQYFNGRNLKFEDNLLLVSDYSGQILDTLVYAGDQQFYSKNVGFPGHILIEESKGQYVFWSNNNYFQKSSATFQTIKLLWIALSVVSLILFLPYGLVWGGIKLVQRHKKPIFSRLILWMACLSFFLIPLGFGMTLNDLVQASKITFSALMVFLSSIAFLGPCYFGDDFEFQTKNRTEIIQNILWNYFSVCFWVKCIFFISWDDRFYDVELLKQTIHQIPSSGGGYVIEEYY